MHSHHPQLAALTQMHRGKIVSAPVPRRNFVDEQIFGKMEHDGIPHSALTSDNWPPALSR